MGLAPRRLKTSCGGGAISLQPSVSELTLALEVACPNLGVADARLVDAGFGSIVLDTGDGLILRIARTAAAARGHAIEAATVPDLARRLPANVPVPMSARTGA